MKKLDKLILRAFVGPFIITFAVVIFIFLVRFLLIYIEEIIGKGLGAEVYIQLLFYFALLLVPVALPLAVLLSTLITFGNLGEHHELTAIKGSGISMIRTLMPVFIVVVALTVFSFYFNNIIVPRASLKAYSLLYDVRTKKASVNFKEGVFYEGIPGYKIKITQKFPDGKSVKGVMIYNHTAGKGNTDVIIADSGLITTINDDRYLVFELYHGKSFSEYAQNSGFNANNHSSEFIRNEFYKSKMIFSLASFDLNRTKEDLFASNKLMKTVDELSDISDSIRQQSNQVKKHMFENIKPFYYYMFYNSTGPATPETALRDTLSAEDKKIILSRAINQARSVKANTSAQLERIKYMIQDARSYEIEKYKKYTQAVACLIMFLIGAPLGAIIKKGGLGVPTLVAILFFIIFYLFSNTGQKWANEGLLPVAIGIWIANIVLFPIGLFFLRQAKNDSRLFESDFYVVWFIKLFKKQSLPKNTNP